MAPINDRTSLLNAATGVVVGGAVSLFTPQKTFTFNKVLSGGTVSALSVSYEGSLNGVDWFTLGTDATTATGPTFVVDKSCLFVRANVTVFTGSGGAPSIAIGMVCMDE